VRTTFNKELPCCCCFPRGADGKYYHKKNVTDNDETTMSQQMMTLQNQQRQRQNYQRQNHQHTQPPPPTTTTSTANHRFGTVPDFKTLQRQRQRQRQRNTTNTTTPPCHSWPLIGFAFVCSMQQFYTVTLVIIRLAHCNARLSQTMWNETVRFPRSGYTNQWS